MRRLVIIIVLNMLLLVANAQINIWEGSPVHKHVALTPYIAQSQNHTSNVTIVVCPGGSYFWHDIETEGHEVGRWLQKNGINAFVLNYRTAYVPAFISHYRLIFRGNRYPDPQDDLCQAIHYIKTHAKEYAVDSARIGCRGPRKLFRLLTHCAGHGTSRGALASSTSAEYYLQGSVTIFRVDQIATACHYSHVQRACRVCDSRHGGLSWVVPSVALTTQQTGSMGLVLFPEGTGEDDEDGK